MIPVWLQAISSLAPLMLLAAIGAIIFGYVRLKRHLTTAREEKEEEERKRLEFIKSMNAKIQDKDLKQ